MAKEVIEFKTEVKEILDLMIHSLYSQKEIFLRELISNASDAINRLKYEEITSSDMQLGSEESHIRITCDPKLRTISVSDNGIGMSREELTQNIGTIAYSGSKSLLSKIKEIKEQPEVIGQFGVGFYSSFMVAERVVLHTQRAGSSEGFVWESNGDGSYSIEEKVRPEGHGTSITLFLKDSKSQQDSDENLQDFSDSWLIKSLVRKYSDFIAHPIKMWGEKEEPEKDENGKEIEGKTKTVPVDEQLNTQKALWLKNAKEIKTEEYNDFYRHLSSDWNEPFEKVHFKVEGQQEFTSLLFFPSKVPFDYNQREQKSGLALYAKRVFITPNCEELLSKHFRFIKGIVDSSDLPLNVSREMIQKDHRIAPIKRAIEGKVLRFLDSCFKDKRKEYEGFWENFGATLKEGVATHSDHKDKILPLLLFHSSRKKGLSSLDEYIARMPKEQKSIYYVTGSSLKTLEMVPYLEKFREKNYEVLFMVDPVDEWLVGAVSDYKEYKFISITKEGIDLETQEEIEKKKEEKESQEKRLEPVISAISESLKEKIKEVKLSSRLVDSPACLVSGEFDNSVHMERMLKSMGQEMPGSKRTLEINPNHPVFEKMLNFDDGKRNRWAEIIYSQALISEGSPLENPANFSKQLSELMLDS